MLSHFLTTIDLTVLCCDRCIAKKLKAGEVLSPTEALLLTLQKRIDSQAILQPEIITINGDKDPAATPVESTIPTTQKHHQQGEPGPHLGEWQDSCLGVLEKWRNKIYERDFKDCSTFRQNFLLPDTIIKKLSTHGDILTAVQLKAEIPEWG